MSDGNFTTVPSAGPLGLPPSSNPYPVAPGGYFIGCLLACILYGIHVAQVYTYFDSASRRRRARLARIRRLGGVPSGGSAGSTGDAPRTHKLIVWWILGMSTVHMAIVWSAGYHYFVNGLQKPKVWGEFYWVLSVQDGTIPLMAATAQSYFGHRAWVLTGRKRWFAILLGVMITITMVFGVLLAVTASLWSANPWVALPLMHSRPIAVPSQAFAITWMGLSALIDGTLTLVLLSKFHAARRGSSIWSTRRLAKRLMALTLETVLLTHAVGATMCVLFLASPHTQRTRGDAFWVLLEVITELYALSVLFTIMSHETVRQGLRGDGMGEGEESDVTATASGAAVGAAGVEEKALGNGNGQGEGKGQGAELRAMETVPELRQSELDRRVEGWFTASMPRHAGHGHGAGVGMGMAGVGAQGESFEPLRDESGLSHDGLDSPPSTWPLTPGSMQDVMSPLDRAGTK